MMRDKVEGFSGRGLTQSSFNLFLVDFQKRQLQTNFMTRILFRIHLYSFEYLAYYAWKHALLGFRKVF
jgi:hypothetical protein